MATFSTAALAGATYYTNSDNVGENGSGPPDNDMDVTVNQGGHIEFNINVATPPTTSASLTVYANDVDEEQGEVDEVFFNGHYIGRLSGANGVWSSTVFHIDPSWVNAGDNLVRVDVSTAGGGWIVTTDWGQLLIDGGAADRGNTGDVEITGHSILGGTVTVDTSIEVNSITGGNYRLEVTIVSPSGDAATVVTQNFAAGAGQTVTQNSSPTYALSSVTGVYQVQSQLFYMDGGFPVQQDIATSAFYHTQNVGPTYGDSDGDGLSDPEELLVGTDPGLTDTDGDGVDDATEVGPNLATPLDSDGDGVIDALDPSIVDTDGDGVLDQNDTANNDPCSPSDGNAACLAFDSDSDGLTNAQEDSFGTGRNTADTDGDGANDGAEVGGNVNAPLNSDGDGVIDALESSILDNDNDGTPNQSDAADTNPCVPSINNAPCLATDSDGDGVPNATEAALHTDPNNADTDGDGINDSAEIGGNPAQPLDGDNDGVPDVLEHATRDTDGDGTPDAADLDSDNDGIPDAAETNNGAPRDADGDGIADHLDRDSDGDGIPDALEAGPNAATPTDTDGDGIPDYLDRDSDGDSVPDALEANVTGQDSDGDGIDDAYDADTTGDSDMNGDGVADSAALRDLDHDGVPDQLDEDADGDGILDRAEANLSGNDGDNDGIDDAMDPQATGGADSDGNGIDDAYELTDSDGDGTPDGRDLDSDNDGVFDVVEAGLIDHDQDGYADEGQAPVSVPRDGDGDGTADYLDLDSDNDGTFDIVASGYAEFDTDDDGRIDAGADADSDGIPDTADPAPLVPGAYADADGDGITDALDLDLDNDGIADSVEGSGDADGDGLPNLADRDSDNDGIPDLVEAGGVDVDGNGVVDTLADTNGNGFADVYEAANGGQALPAPDSDGDGMADYIDVDSDGDGLSDAYEAGGVDANNDGRIDAIVDSNGDGLADSVDVSLGGARLRRSDADADGKADYLDGDSDNDGIADGAEGRGDADGDGTPDYLDKPGKLSTAVSGGGSFNWLWIVALSGVAALRRRVQLAPLAAVAIVGIAGLNSSNSFAGDTAEQEGFYVGADVGLSWLEPEDRGGGYAVDDDRSEGFRLLGGYSWSPRWAAEVFYVDAGEAGIASDNAAVGHLGELEYEMFGGGLEWRPLGVDGFVHPVLKAGAAAIDNKVTDSRINFDRENSLSFYFGAGVALQIHAKWLLQADWVSYDKDDSFLSLGIRRRL